MKKILLTGASGFLGSHCLPLLLERGYEVYAVTSKKSTAPNCSGVHWVSLDLLDSGAVGDFFKSVRLSHLLHFAWFMKPGESYTSLENYKWVQASLELLRKFVDQGGQRAVMAGSCAEYNWDYGYCVEDITPLVSSTPYGICKNSLQALFTSYVKQSGISGSWGRMFFLYGPRENKTRLVSSVICALLAKKVAQCSHCTQIRDYMYVEDAAEAYICLLESDVQGPVNIASGQPTVLKDIVFRLAEKLNGKELIHFNSIQGILGEPRLVVAGINRLANEVGFTARYNLETGLTKTIHWWEDKLNNRKRSPASSTM